MRRLVLILGDQLNDDAAVFDDFDPEQDAVWMTEVRGEAEHVWSHKARIAMFFAAMRCFRDKLKQNGITVYYRELNAPGNQGDLGSELKAAISKYSPQQLALTSPGEYRVREMLVQAAGELDLQIDIRCDKHFLCTDEEFQKHAEGRKQLRMEYFYREMRRRYNILMDDDQPAGGSWNYDKENRGSFSQNGPGDIAEPVEFPPCETTREVLELVDRLFDDHPGSLEHFDWPVTAEQAEQALEDFIENRLPDFGKYQDAMWTDEPYLYHSRLSAAMNLKLIDPLQVVQAVEEAYQEGHAPLNAAEGFIRQILGWREYTRGVYWLYMPEYLQRNGLQADAPLPEFFWNGETEMNCLKQAIQQTLKFGYAHHIQRLMITGLFPLLLGVSPQAVHEWYLAVYVDAVEWVVLPISLRMSKHADGGVMGSKPYIASGKYIDRMSNYCSGCRFNPGEATGDDACPFTTLYWDFLMRHRKELEKNPRMSMQVKNLDRKPTTEQDEIRSHAESIKAQCAESSDQ